MRAWHGVDAGGRVLAGVVAEVAGTQLFQGSFQALPVGPFRSADLEDVGAKVAPVSKLALEVERGESSVNPPAAAIRMRRSNTILPRQGAP